ncbi:peptide ABC transporter substrate-binding protein [Rubellicoccus peritrichatus]|uniref:Peptide ABC transporter substrate-binding protein n=1 Tax=Rubellicoccus peritrichatus TaxID=3080537 RepID=A0AAQ3L8M3_9BACT|nr:peptide ABC transporter substrate-binding protein [Puniceicoccus sp. CR14]WOO39939.1 peptide ABC transporter substrate-binding protein [Puniceicoccus sp. CR14]
MQAKQVFSLINLSLFIIFFFTGCSERITPVERANKEQILLKANGADPATLDPQLATGVIEFDILLSLFEGLMKPNPVTLDPEPAVAESYEASEDGKRYTFFFRKDALWSNGDPITAHDFEFSYKRILSPNLGSQYAYMLYPILNASKFNQGEIDDFAEVGVKAIDDHTLQIDLESPTPYFLSLILHLSWYPVHPPTILKHGEMDELGTRWTRPGNMVSNGPFALKKWSVNDDLVVTRNTNYWDNDAVALNGIHFLPIENLNTEERAFRAGQVHITKSIPLSKVDSYRASGSKDLRINPYLGIYYYTINTTRPPLDNIEVRKALSMAIDRKLITEKILKGGQLPALHFTPPNTGGYTTEYNVQENVEEAQKLLADAGFPGGKNFPVIELLYNSSESHKLIAEAIQQMWKKNLGIDVSLINQDWKVYLNSRRQKDYDIARASWIGDFVDPINFLDLMASYSGNNHTGWASLEFDELLDEASRTSDPEKRFTILQEAEAMALKEMPVIPIYFYMSVYLVNPAVEGWHANILDWHPYQAISLKNEAN